MTQVRDPVRDQIKEMVDGVAPPTCHHFWVIAAASGPTSKGKCKRCGATKDFYNAFPEAAPAPRTSVLDLPELPEIDLSEEPVSS